MRCPRCGNGDIVSHTNAEGEWDGAECRECGWKVA